MSESDLDPRSIDLLGQFEAADALEVLEQYAGADMTNVRNKVRRQLPTGGPATSPFRPWRVSTSISSLPCCEPSLPPPLNRRWPSLCLPVTHQ